MVRRVERCPLCVVVSFPALIGIAAFPTYTSTSPTPRLHPVPDHRGAACDPGRRLAAVHVAPVSPEATVLLEQADRKSSLRDSAGQLMMPTTKEGR